MIESESAETLFIQTFESRLSFDDLVKPAEVALVRVLEALKLETW